MKQVRLSLGVAALLAGCGAQPCTCRRPSPLKPVVERRVANPAVPWMTIADVAQLRDRLAAAQRQGTPVVAFVSAAWCGYCQDLERILRNDASVRAALERVVLLRVDVTEDPRRDIRDALGMPVLQPFVMFIDGCGARVRELDLTSRPDIAMLVGRLRDPRIAGR